MLSIKRLLYSLKRRFGTHIDLYQEVDTEPDVLTGKRIQTRIKYSVPLGIFLDQTTLTFNPLSKTLGQLTGMLNVNEVSILFDADDVIVKNCECKCKYIPTLNDYVIINHQRYEIDDIRQVDNNQSYWFKLIDYKGAQLFEQFDILIKDKLTLVQTMKVIHNYTYIEDLDQQLNLLDISNINIISNQSLNDTLNFNEALQT